VKASEAERALREQRGRFFGYKEQKCVLQIILVLAAI